MNSETPRTDEVFNEIVEYLKQPGRTLEEGIRHSITRLGQLAERLERELRKAESNSKPYPDMATPL